MRSHRHRWVVYGLLLAIVGLVGACDGITVKRAPFPLDQQSPTIRNPNGTML